MEKEFVFVVDRVVETGHGCSSEKVASFNTFEEAVSFWREQGGFAARYGIHIAHPRWY